MKNRVENIQKQEENLDKIEEALEELQSALKKWKQVRPCFDELMAYYNSPQWQEDCEADSKGAFVDLKRGVLSQDAVYDIYHRERNLSLELIRTALESLEK